VFRGRPSLGDHVFLVGPFFVVVTGLMSLAVAQACWIGLSRPWLAGTPGFRRF